MSCPLGYRNHCDQAVSCGKTCLCFFFFPLRISITEIFHLKCSVLKLSCKGFHSVSSAVLDSSFIYFYKCENTFGECGCESSIKRQTQFTNMINSQKMTSTHTTQLRKIFPSGVCELCVDACGVFAISTNTTSRSCDTVNIHSLLRAILWFLLQLQQCCHRYRTFFQKAAAIHIFCFMFVT